MGRQFAHIPRSSSCLIKNYEILYSSPAELFTSFVDRNTTPGPHCPRQLHCRDNACAVRAMFPLDVTSSLSCKHAHALKGHHSLPHSRQCPLRLAELSLLGIKASELIFRSRPGARALIAHLCYDVRTETVGIIRLVLSCVNCLQFWRRYDHQ